MPLRADSHRSITLEVPENDVMIRAFKTIDSPVGTLKLIASDTALIAVLWENDDPKRVRVGPIVENVEHPILCETEHQLAEYFSGQRKAFALPLEFVGTAFQKRVWGELLHIPFGETRTYAELAQTVGNARAFRAVGAANGRNPISIIAPCHRVIGKNGSLTGFAGGLDAKGRLLRIEAN
jgi:methylated-DNA-[protein]-cysteine S-methyltransferase